MQRLDCVVQPCRRQFAAQVSQMAVERPVADQHPRPPDGVHKRGTRKDLTGARHEPGEDCDLGRRKRDRRSVDAGVFKRDRVALAKLFASVSRPKRSKIGSFLKIVRALEDALHFPTQLNERNGLALAQALAADDETADKVRAALQAKPPRDAAAEASTITAAIAPKAETPAPSPALTLPPLRSGLRYKETAKGEVVLSGPALQDQTFKAALLAFLAKSDPE